MTYHHLKIEEEHFDRIAAGEKTFEIRRNDRFFATGHSVLLECNNQHGHVGAVKADIGYITDFEQKPGYCVFSLENAKNSL